MIADYSKLAFREFLLYASLNESSKESILYKLSNDQLKHLIYFLSSKKAGHLFIPYCKEIGLSLSEDIIEFSNKYAKVYSLTRFILQDKAIKEISKILDKEGIRYIFLKGAETRSLYKNPYFRVSNDIDILVDFNNKKAVTQLLLNKLKGKRDRKDDVHDTIVVYEKMVKIEIHGDLFRESENKGYNYLFSNPFNQAIKEDKSFRYHFNTSFNYAYLLAHTFKHIRTYGTYLPQLSDLFVIYKSNLYVEDEINTVLEKGNLFKLNNYLVNLFDKYINNDELSNKEDLFETFLLEKEDSIYVSVNKYKYDSKFKWVMARLFYPKAMMNRAYPITEKYPILLPCFHVYRWFSALFRKGSVRKSVEHLSEYSNLNLESQEKNAQLFKEIGL